jgi:hypothetical protein
MAGSCGGRRWFTGKYALSVGAGWIAIALSGCGGGGAAAPEGAVQSDAGGMDAAKPPPADAASPTPSASATGALTGTQGVGTAPPMMTAVPGVTSMPSPAMTMPAMTIPSTMPMPMPSSSVPSAWTPVDSPLEGQSDCKERVSLTETRCSYSLDCAPDSLSSHCSIESGETYCNCSNVNQSDYRQYTVLPGTDLETACRATIVLCNGDNAPEAQEPDCEEGSASDGYSCSWEKLCTSSVELAEGVIAVEESRPIYGSCNATGSDVSWCSCSNSNQGIEVHGVNIESACGALAPLCRSELTPDEDPYCIEPSMYVDAFSCSSSRHCGTRTDLTEAGDVYALSQTFPRDAYCTPDGENSAQCYCDSNYGRLLEGTVASEFQDACSIIDDVCHSGLLPEARGGIQCGSQSAQATGGSCTGSATCSQEFSKGESALLANAQMYSTCEPDGNGAWSCVCNGGGGLESQAETVSAPNAIRACMNAIDSCALRGHFEIAELGIQVVFADLPDGVDAGEPPPDPVDPIDATVGGDL